MFTRLQELWGYPMASLTGPAHCAKPKVKRHLITLLAVLVLTGFKTSLSAQCGEVFVEGVLTYCNSFDNGTVLTDSFFVGFRVVIHDGDTLDVVDREGNATTNRGKRIYDLGSEDEPADITIEPLMVEGGGADTVQIWYFGPFANGASFDIWLGDPNMECDSVFVAAGTFTCVGQDPMACDMEDPVPLYFLDFSETQFNIGEGDPVNENVGPVFLIMERTREQTCCDLNPTLPSNAGCFEFIIRLGQDDIGIINDDVGSGSTAGEIFADSLSGFTCTGMGADNTWPFQQGGGQSNDLTPLCLVSGVEDYVVLNCKSGGNTTSATIGALKAPFTQPDVTVEPCDAQVQVFQADSVTWSSDDDPGLNNFVMCTGDSTICDFLYDEAFFGPVAVCEGDTFFYIAGATPGQNECFDADTVLYDTTYVVVYPVFEVTIDTNCTAQGDVMLTATVTSAAMGCPYDYAWSTGAMTSSITVPADGAEYSVTVSRSDIDVDTCVIVADTINALPALTLDCSNIQDASYQCVDEVPPADPSLVMVSGCGIAGDTIVEESDNGGGGCIGDTLFITRYYIIDIDGNAMTTEDQDTCTQIITVVDNTIPMISCPADVTVECDESIDPADTGMATATDNCTDSPTITYSDSITPGNCDDTYTINRTWSALDACGNVATCVQTIDVQDTSPPMIMCPVDVTVECGGDLSPASTGMATATDNCDSAPAVSFSDGGGANGCVGGFVRTWTATDACGNTATCTQLISFGDDEVPMITCPADVTVECDESTDPADTGMATATDNCDQNPAVTYSDSETPGACAGQYTISRTWFATDVCGNVATCVQMIQVDDTTLPIISCPTDVTVECDESTDPADTGMATATDNCDQNPTVTWSDDFNPGLCALMITRTWTAIDECGNTSTCVQTIDVVDNTPPQITCPGDTTIDCDTDPSPAATGSPTVEDNCDSSPSSTFSDVVTPGACGEERTITRTWTAVDVCGNQSTCVQTITVQDTTPPTAICQDIIVDFAGNDTVYITADMVDDGSFDNCGDVTLAVDQDTFVCTEIQNDMAVVTLTVTDECGLESTCTANIMFMNASLLTLECPDEIVIDPPDGVCEVLLDYEIIANDLCGNTVMIEQIDNSGFTAGDLVPEDTMFFQTYRAYNMQGDTLTCTFPVTILEQEGGGGEMACKHALNLSLDEDCKATITPGLLLTIDPGCDALLEVSPKDDSFVLIDGNMVDDSYVGMTIAVMVTDLISGNACWTLVTVEDKLPPAITCGSDTVFCYESTAPIDIGLPVEDAEEIIENADGSFTVLGIGQCGPVHFTYFDETLFKNCASPFTKMIKRNWTATDVNGNSSQCMDSIYVERIGIDGITFPEHFDNIENPALECTSNCILPDGSPDVACTGEPDGLTCDNIWIRYTDQFVPKCGGAYKVLRQWRVLDLCTGDETVFVQKILIDDSTPPVVECQDTITVTGAGPNCMGSVHLPLPDITDACSDYTIDVFAPDGTLHENNGEYWVSDLAFGCHVITFVVTDECFNVASCEQVVCVGDLTEPVAICDLHSIVTLSEPVTLITAESLSDNSYDACSDITFAGRRMNSCIDIDWTTSGADSDETPNGVVNEYDEGTVFQSEIPFACCDVGIPVMVEIRVTDEAGNSNSCMVEVTTQDKSVPEIECPPHITVNCDFVFDLEALNDIDDRTYGTVLNGLFYDEFDRLPVIVDGTEWGKDGIANDLCGLEVTLEVVDNRNMCGLGTIERTFIATDGVNSVDCTQEILVVNEDPFSEEDNIIWPGDITLEGGCEVDISETGEPLILDADCDLVGVAYDDLVIPFDPNACAKIVRTWQVLDWCTYESGVYGLWTHQQVIKVVNNVGPEPVEPVEDLVLCQDDAQVTVDDPNDCMANVALSLIVADDCTEAGELRWGYVVDLFNDGDFEVTSPLFDAGENGSFVQGNTLVLQIEVDDMPMNDGANADEMHHIQWVVADRCGNESRINQLIRLNDCKDPIVICQDLIASINNENDEVTIWASDFNASSADNCTDTSDLVYSFSGSEIIPSMTFDCDDAIANGSEDFEVDVWVFDEYGNAAFCTVTFTLDGAQSQCGLMLTTISGSLASQKGQQVQNAAVDLMEQSEMYANTTSNDAGNYGFSALPMHSDYMVKPFKNDDTKKGVSTLDLITIQKHILGIQEFSNPYQYIAADVNNSETVSALDLIELRKVILGILTEFPENTSWRFIPQGFTFVDPASPWPFEESIQYNDVAQSMTEADFTGIKVGDVNESYVAGAQVIVSRSAQEMAFLRIKDQEVSAGQIVRVPVQIDTRGAKISGLQFALHSDQIRWSGLEGNPSMAIGMENYSIGKTTLRTSWHSVNTISEEAAVITLQLEVLQDGKLSDMLHLDQSALSAELYTGDLAIRPLELSFGTEHRHHAFALFQNTPNPWSEETTIGFELPEDLTVTLRVYDATGRVLLQREADGQSGYNELTIDDKVLDGTSIMYYRLTAGEYSATKKMVLWK